MISLQYFNDVYDGGKEQMRQSIVIKARVQDNEKMENAIFEMTESLGTVFLQEDVYFNVPQGNLKLRIMHPNRCGQLIFNEISKKSGHKLSESQITEVEDVLAMRATLGAALGERGTIRKKRRVFVLDDVRIYLDDVDEVGNFIDIAVTLKGSHDDCEKRAEDVRRKLGVDQSAVVPSAYLDLLMSQMSFDDASSVTSSSDPTDDSKSSSCADDSDSSSS
ncbi:unnamed protein product [Caenorhabditis auriculariae]|uniref:CYTH domain-containing protein n=1 Tax=Caenorhabditis auriculariae TaxID=2777116 RepID=A0A8S1H3W1_9PELO|nr:unnamed protein product [Caenorhabditis auriculariae]